MNNATIHGAVTNRSGRLSCNRTQTSGCTSTMVVAVIMLLVSACAAEHESETVLESETAELDSQDPRFAYALHLVQDDSRQPDLQAASPLPGEPGPEAETESTNQPLVINPEPDQPAPDTEANGSSPEAQAESVTGTEQVSEVSEAPETSDSNSNNGTQANRFVSYSTAGFEAVLNDDGSAELIWNAMPGARGYNVYRAAEYHATVFTNSFTDQGLDPTENYYYRIEAFDAANNFTRLADGLTIQGPQSVSVTDAPDAIKQNYELVFSEEFNGSSLDTTKWNTAYLWGTDIIINQEEQYYVDLINEPDFGYNPFEFTGETLRINAIRTPDNLRSQAQNQSYLSGVITTYDAFKFTYGYVEARVKMPRGQGLWAALWLLNAYYVEKEPEIDIVEHIGHEADRVYHTYHYYDENDVLHSTDSLESAGVDYTDSFNTFGVEWLPGLLVYYINGEEVHRIASPNVSSQEMYILANMALGGWWPGSPDETTRFPAQYEIDYIRAYQRTGQLPLPPQLDEPTAIPFQHERSGSPNHRPDYEQWPAGYPDR